MKDFLTDDNGDLLIVNGDFVIGESSHQHINDIVLSNKGDFKQWPLLGFGAHRYLKTVKKPIDFERDLKIQLEYAGFENPKIDLSQGYDKLKINV